jgi:hypothetical protein
LAIPATVSTHRAAGDITNRAFGIGPPATIPATGYVTGGVGFGGATILDIASLAAIDSSTILTSFWYSSPNDIPGGGDPVWVGDTTNTSALQSFAEGTFLRDPTFANRLVWGGTISPVLGVWHHVLMAADVNHAAGLRPHWIFYDDVDITDVPSDDTGIAFVMAANGLEFTIGGDTFGDNVTMSFADCWWGLGQFADLTVTANRRKFISAALHPVDLGAAGELPTGAPPTFFLRRAPTALAATFANDLSGNGNNFNIVGAALTSVAGPVTAGVA